MLVLNVPLDGLQGLRERFAETLIGGSHVCMRLAPQRIGLNTTLTLVEHMVGQRASRGWGALGCRRSIVDPVDSGAVGISAVHFRQVCLWLAIQL